MPYSIKIKIMKLLLNIFALGRFLWVFNEKYELFFKSAITYVIYITKFSNHTLALFLGTALT